MGRKVLVVDDEKLLLAAVERALSKVGYEVFAAPSLQTLRGLVCSAPFDLLITDIHVADDTFADVIDLVKTSSPGVRVLLMSGALDVSRSYPFIEKPFSISNLRQRVKEILDGALDGV